MPKTSIIASNITNLTDARYFAAMGVDYLLFDLKDIEIQTIVSIIEWISGPKILLRFDKQSIEIIDEAIIRIQPEAIAYDGDKNQIEYLQGHTHFFTLSTVSNALQISLNGKNFTSHFQSDMDPNLGLIVQGSDESKVGFKSFDELDEIFDNL